METNPWRLGEERFDTVLGMVGMLRGAWKVFDRLVGSSLFRCPALARTATSYHEVILVQSACWGMQDRMLAWVARRHKWRTVLVPYTTDQLFCNGDLVSDFDAILVQDRRKIAMLETSTELQRSGSNIVALRGLGILISWRGQVRYLREAARSSCLAR